MRQGVRWSSEGRTEDNGVGASRPHTTRAVRDKVVVETGQGAGDGRGSLRLHTTTLGSNDDNGGLKTHLKCLEPR